MEPNETSIHVSSGNINVGDLETSETEDNIFDFLENQMDETKRLILAVLSFKDFNVKFVDKFLVSMDTQEQLELDVGVNKYSKFFVACYNRSYLTLNSENLILLRHSKDTADDVMIDTINENIEHQILSNSIRGAFDNPHAADRNGRLHLEGQWKRNIFTRLKKCFRIYAIFFEELASTYKELLFKGAATKE